MENKYATFLRSQPTNREGYVGLRSSTYTTWHETPKERMDGTEVCHPALTGLAGGHPARVWGRMTTITGLGLQGIFPYGHAPQRRGDPHRLSADPDFTPVSSWEVLMVVLRSPREQVRNYLLR